MRRVLGAGVLCVIVAALLGCGVARVAGVHFLHVRSASMGTAAPVGSLVIATPVEFSRISVGDIVAFQPDAGSAASSTAAQTVVTHRVAAVTPEGLVTRGDNNSGNDARIVTASMVLGRASAVWWGAGAALQALPPIALGCALVILLARWFARRRTAGTIRAGDHDAGRAILVAGVPIVIAVVLAAQRPLVGIVSLGTGYDQARDVLRSDVVSTGLLPTRVSAQGGDERDMVSGEKFAFEGPARSHTSDVGPKRDQPSSASGGDSAPTGSTAALMLHASPALHGIVAVIAALIVGSPLLVALLMARRNGGRNDADTRESGYALPVSSGGTL